MQALLNEGWFIRKTKLFNQVLTCSFDKEFKAGNLYFNHNYDEADDLVKYTLNLNKISFAQFINGISNIRNKDLRRWDYEFKSEYEVQNPDFLDLNPIFIFEGISWSNIVMALSNKNISLTGGSITRRYKLNLCEYRLSQFLNLIGYFKSQKKFYKEYTESNITYKEERDIVWASRKLLSILDANFNILNYKDHIAFQYYIRNLMEYSKSFLLNINEEKGKKNEVLVSFEKILHRIQDRIDLIESFKDKAIKQLINEKNENFSLTSSVPDEKVNYLEDLEAADLVPLENNYLDVNLSKVEEPGKNKKIEIHINNYDDILRLLYSKKDKHLEKISSLNKDLESIQQDINNWLSKDIDYKKNLNILKIKYKQLLIEKEKWKMGIR